MVALENFDKFTGNTCDGVLFLVKLQVLLCNFTKNRPHTRFFTVNFLQNFYTKYLRATAQSFTGSIQCLLLHKKWSFPLRISSVKVTKSAFPANLVIFTEEILNRKLPYLCSIKFKIYNASKSCCKGSKIKNWRSHRSWLERRWKYWMGGKLFFNKFEQCFSNNENLEINDDVSHWLWSIDYKISANLVTVNFKWILKMSCC